jgi:hypothetical protein
MNLFKLLGFVLLCSAINTVSYADNKKSQRDQLRPMVVYKSPSCGCCGDWVKHMETGGYALRIKHPENLNAVKESLGISPRYQACHTGVKSGYYFEGHIPVEVVKKFLAEKPENVVGLAVPGMPLGSPGMDVPGDYRPYEVLKIHKDGNSTPYARVSIEGIDYL